MNLAKTSITENELRIFWTASQELADARRRQRPIAIRHATDEIAAIAMHTERPALRNAALRLLAA